MKETWGPPAGAGWPEFCHCGKKRNWQETKTEDGSYVLMDFHLCTQPPAEALVAAERSSDGNSCKEEAA